MSNDFSSSAQPPPEPWARLWVPVQSWNAMPSLDEDFLAAPAEGDSYFDLFANSIPGIQGIEGFGSVPFLLLLGRPGSGKSHELRQAAERNLLGSSECIDAKEIGSAHPGLYLDSLDLTARPTPPDRILIDGLDEALISNPDFVPQLRAWFQRHRDAHGKPRFHLAITCRWADWPESQVRELANLWQPDQCMTLVLGPLRRADVIATLERRFADKAEFFWKEMHRLHLVRIACWPQGFNRLMDAFENNGRAHIADSYAEVIGDHVVRRCRLADTSQDTKRWVASVDGAEWRRRIAGRIAATMTFCGRSQLVLEPTSLHASDCLSHGDLAHTSEVWDGKHREITLSDLDSIVRRTGLLRMLGDKHRWVFESQVDQDWLAADWLTAQRLDERRLRQVFGVTIEGHWQVAPPLKTVAAWLAGRDQTFRHLLLEADPLVLLRMDASSLPDADRRDVIDALLRATDRAQVVDPGIRQENLWSLHHPGASEQLASWIANAQAASAARELAVEMASKMKCESLVALLWTLCESTSGRLKSEIASALWHLAKEGWDEQWRKVLNREIASDEETTLIGAALEIMVIESRKVPVRDVLRWAIPTVRSNYWGLFETQVRKLHEHLVVGDLPVLFEKLAEQPTAIHDSLCHAHDLSASAVRLAIRALDQPGVLDVLVDYWHRCDERHVTVHHDLNQQWSKESLGLQDDEKRRRLMSALISHPAFCKHEGHRYISVSDYLVLPEDFEWLVDQMIAAPVKDQWRYALLVSTVGYHAKLEASAEQKFIEGWTKCQAIQELLPAPKKNETIIEAIARTKAEHQKKRTQEEQGWQQEWKKKQQKFEADLVAFTDRCRVDHAAGKVVWPGVDTVLSARLNGPGGGSVGWNLLSQIRAGEDWMREAAERYLIQRPLERALDEHSGMYGLLALGACLPILDADNAARRSVIDHWLPTFIDHLVTVLMGDAPEGLNLEWLASIAPDQFAQAFGAVYRSRYAKQGSLEDLNVFKRFWTEEMTDQLESMLRDESFQPSGFFHAMRHLVSRRRSAAIEIASDLISKVVDETPPEHRVVLVGTAALLFDGALNTSLARFLKDAGLVGSAIRGATRRMTFHREEVTFDAWSNEALRDLANACWQAFPAPDRFRHNSFGFHEITDFDDATHFRDQITVAARNRGIEVQIPAQHDSDSQREADVRRHIIASHRYEAANAKASQRWLHLSSNDFLHLVATPNARLARNNDELLEAVIESIQQWQTHLTAGAVSQFWDAKGEISVPELKIANHLRDWLHNQMDVVVECEIRLASADRTDILVKTTPASPAMSQRVVIVEVKKHRKSNAKERRTAMKTQLRDRYLTERQHENWTHGLYVLAWTPEPGGLDSTDEALERATNALADQARELSQEDFSIRALVVDLRWRPKTAKHSSTQAKRLQLPKR